MGRKSRQKGKRGEREACDVLRDTFPDVKRTAMQSRGGGEQPDLASTSTWWVEVGVGNVNPRAKWEQAKLDCYGNEPIGNQQTPIALTKRDRGEWLVTLHVEDFKRLLKDARPLLGWRPMEPCGCLPGLPCTVHAEDHP